MLKKFKIKLILHNMLFIGMVVLTTFVALNFLIYVTEEIKLSEQLEENIEFVREDEVHLPHPPSESNDLVYEVSFTLFVSRSGMIISQSPHNIESQELTNAVKAVIESEYERGNLKGLNLSFLKKEVKNGYLISFLSREHLEERTGEFIGYSVVMALLSMVLFLFISKAIANIALAPVEKAWEQQKQFLADASHDLKTPLTVILANNNILASHKDDTVESQMKWIESTNEEAGRMSDLVNKMLELAKSESSVEELKLTRTNLSELIENSILQFEVVAFERNITIENGIQPDVFVKTHSPTFSKILEILFDNAIKYSDENGKISVALIKTSKKVYFSINNGGEYIQEDDIPRIFERFYRTNKEREVGGHGLGLSLAKKKCNMIGAKISVESTPEEGTTFTITMKNDK